MSTAADCLRRRPESAGPSRPIILLEGGRAAYIGPSLNLAPHRNGVATVAVALDRPFLLDMFDQNGAVQQSIKTSICLIPPGTRHHLRSTGDIAFIYLDAVSDDLNQIAAADLARAHASISGDIRDLREKWHFGALCVALGASGSADLDVRLVKAVRMIDEEPQRFPRLADAARLAQLSPTRFHALFRKSLGIPYRRYRLWRRMAIAVQRAASGDSLTGAAIDSGFSSSAHFSTAFRAMFGLAPSQLLAMKPMILTDSIGSRDDGRRV